MERGDDWLDRLMTQSQDYRRSREGEKAICRETEEEETIRICRSN